MSLSNKAMLVNLSISQWVGRKLDKRATETVEVTHGTEKDCGNFTKKLLPGAKQLKEIGRIAGEIRAYVYEQTLPWATDGSRILSSKNTLDFMSGFATRKESFDRAVSEFINEYPTLKYEAKSRSGDLFNESEYPSPELLRQKFNCQVIFMPMPEVTDFRVELSEYEKDKFVQSLQDVEANAVKECWTRMYDVVSKAAAKLNDPEAIFRNSLIENISDMCKLMPKLNVTEDPQLDSMVKDLEKLALSINPEACREIGVIRHDAAAKLAEITSKMSGYMVG